MEEDSDESSLAGAGGGSGKGRQWELKLVAATELPQLSYRQVKRWWRRYRRVEGKGLKPGRE